MVLKNFNPLLFSLFKNSESPKCSVKTLSNLLLFVAIIVSIFSVTSKSCFAAGFANVLKGTFDGGSYDIFQRHEEEGRLIEQTFYNFQNKTGLDANDFHIELVTYSGSYQSNVPIVANVQTFDFPYPGDNPASFPNGIPWIVPDDAYFSPTGYLQNVYQGATGLPASFIQDVYWTFNGERLGAPPNPVTGNPPIGLPSISGDNSYCITPKSNLACNDGTVGDKPSQVPEPSIVIGWFVAAGFGVFLRNKYFRKGIKKVFS
jgi:hypothetical protein